MRKAIITQRDLRVGYGLRPNGTMMQGSWNAEHFSVLSKSSEIISKGSNSLWKTMQELRFIS